MDTLNELFREILEIRGHKVVTVDLLGHGDAISFDIDTNGNVGTNNCNEAPFKKSLELCLKIGGGISVESIVEQKIKKGKKLPDRAFLYAINCESRTFAFKSPEEIESDIKAAQLEEFFPKAKYIYAEKQKYSA